MTVTLTTIGSSGVTIDVRPSALPEAGPGGVVIELALHDGPLMLTLTHSEAVQLAADLSTQVAKRSPAASGLSLPSVPPSAGPNGPRHDRATLGSATPLAR